MSFQTVKFRPKDFRQRRPDGRGGWTWDLQGEQLVPYRLPELLAADPAVTVYDVEGEKDIERLRSLRLTATTNAMGAGKWRDEYAEHFRRRRVVILPDNDEPGRRHAEQVTRSLHRVAASVKILPLPGLPDKGDVSDWLDAGHGADELEALAAEAPEWTPHSTGPRVMTTAELLNLRLPVPRSPLPGILPDGLGMLVSRPKLGKTWMGLGMAVAVASDGKVFGALGVDAGDVLYLALEDGQRRLQTRLSALVDEDDPPSRLHVATEWPRLDEGGLEMLDGWLAGHPGARLVFVDTLKRVRPRGDRRASLYDQDYEALGPLADLAKRHGVCILVVHHTRKASADDPLELVSGSFGLSGAVDGVLVLKRDRGQADAVLSVVDRDHGDQDLALRWDADTFTWVLLGDAADYRRSKERAELIALLRRSAEPMDPKRIADALGKKRGAVRFLLHKMKQDGEVQKVGAGYTAAGTNTANTANTHAVEVAPPGGQRPQGVLAPVSDRADVANRCATAPDGAHQEDISAPAPAVSAVSDVSAAEGDAPLLAGAPTALPRTLRPATPTVTVDGHVTVHTLPPAGRPWRCMCGSLERRYRQQWADWACRGCGATAPAPEAAPVPDTPTPDVAAEQPAAPTPASELRGDRPICDACQHLADDLRSVDGWLLCGGCAAASTEVVA